MDYSWRRLRGHLIVLAALALGALGGESAQAAIADDWSVFKSSFVMADGRVVDSPAGTAHARSQGIALLGAVAADDRDAFSHILRWTEANLDIRGDGLYAGAWLPEAGVLSKQDSADADLLIAWALLRAEDKWHAPDLKDAALRSLVGIRKHLLREHGGYLILLPAAEGYDGQRSTTINLSDWIFPALKSFQAADPTPLWQRLTTDGLGLLEKARFGAGKLPTDWIDIDDHGAVAPAAGKPPRFGGDAQQIPLFLAWGLSGDRRLPDLLAPFLKRWAQDTGATAPLWIDVSTGAIAPSGAGPGLDAILAAARAASGEAHPVMPVITAALDYRAASLVLLGRISLAPAN